MRTYMPKKADIDRQWWLVDAENGVVGRLASRIARILMGKHRPTYVPHVDTGDFVIVVNAEKVRFTGRKADAKRYYRYSGYPSGLKERTVADVLEKKPEDLVYLAVRRMLPKTRLGRQMIRKLKIYAGPAHPHEAQGPQPLDLKNSLI